MLKKRRFYSLEQKQTIMKHIQRYDRKSVNGMQMFNPSKMEYVEDMAVLLDHIFSYEFKTHQADKQHEINKKLKK